MPGAWCTCAMARWNMIARETEIPRASRSARCPSGPPFAALIPALMLWIAPADAAPPYLTGVVEDGQGADRGNAAPAGCLAEEH